MCSKRIKWIKRRTSRHQTLNSITAQTHRYLHGCTCSAAWSPWGRTCPCGKLRPQRWPPPRGLWPPLTAGCGSVPPRPARRCDRLWPAAPGRAGLVHPAPPPLSSSHRHFCHSGTLREKSEEKMYSSNAAVLWRSFTNHSFEIFDLRTSEISMLFCWLLPFIQSNSRLLIHLLHLSYSILAYFKFLFS